MAPPRWSQDSVANPSSPLDAVRASDQSSWRDLHLAPGERFVAGELPGRTIIFGEGEHHSARVVKTHRRLHVIVYENGREFTIDLRSKGRNDGVPFQVLRHDREVSQRKARKMAKATQRMPEFRDTLLTKMRDGHLRRAFEEWDSNGDGTLSASELRVGLARLAKVSEEDMQKVIDAGGVKGEGLSYADLLQVIASLDASQRLAKKLGKQFRAQLQSEQDTLYEAFDRFDDDGDGVLTRRELVEGLRETMKSTGVALSKQDERELMQVLDSDGDGTVDYHEFVKFVTQDEEERLKVSTFFFVQPKRPSHRTSSPVNSQRDILLAARPVICGPSSQCIKK
jgi:Ca2+-binding EF-hand superfamily protein